jgi:hypothetical protein
MVLEERKQKKEGRTKRTNTQTKVRYTSQQQQQRTPRKKGEIKLFFASYYQFQPIRSLYYTYRPIRFGFARAVLTPSSRVGNHVHVHHTNFEKSFAGIIKFPNFPQSR